MAARETPGGRSRGVAARRGRIGLLSLILANSRLLPGLKCVNYPFLNCYSCPAAIGACPVGTVQHFVILREVPLFVIGVIGAVASIWGRMTCAWLCPFGYVQDLLHRIPWPRRKLRVRTRKFAWVKYGVLAGLVVVIPYVTLEPWFCKLCPAGTIEAALPWLALSPPLRDLVGPFFWFKLALAAGFVLLAVALSRPFCRFACPLGAVYGLANSFSRVRIEVDREKCTLCGECERVCPMGLEPHRDVNSTDCIRCRQCDSICEHVTVVSPPLPWSPRRARPAHSSCGRGPTPRA